jgi:hypothetical protein
VESYFISQGLLLPGYSQSYWLGLVADSNTWPNFGWLSRSIPAPNPDTYSGWGASPAKPNNATGADLCAAANSSYTTDGA